MIQNRSAVLWWSSLVVMIHLFEIVPDYKTFMGMGLKSKNEDLEISTIFSAIVGVVLLYNGLRFASSVFVNYRNTVVKAENIKSLWECATGMMNSSDLKPGGPTALFSVLAKGFEDPEMNVNYNYTNLKQILKKPEKIREQINIRNKIAKQEKWARRFQFWCLDVFPPTGMFIWAFCLIHSEFLDTWKLVLFG